MFADGQTRKSDVLENAFDINSIVDDTTKKVSKKKRRLKMKGYKNVKFLPTNFAPKPLSGGRTAYLCNKCGKGCTNMSGLQDVHFSVQQELWGQNM